MGKTIVLCNQKGGVGKTTTAINLGACLALKKKKVLVVDFDPQGNASSGLGIDKKQLETSVYNLLIGQASLEKAIHTTCVDNLSIIPSNIHLTGAEIELVAALGREYKLKNVLNPIRETYDYIFIDAPPSLGLLTINALVASDTVMIPLQCEYYALEGLSQLLDTIQLIKNHLNSTLEIEGVLLTMADHRTNLTNEIIKEAKNYFKEKIYETIIQRNIKLSEAPGFGKPVILYDAFSLGARKYDQCAEEFLKNQGKKEVRENPALRIEEPISSL